MVCPRLTAPALLAVLMLSVLGPRAEALGWDDLMPALTSQIKHLWQNRELQFMDYTCFYIQRPSFYRWELYYRGSFFCPTWSRVKGKSKTRSQSGAMTRAIEDYIRKVRDRNLITEREATLWLEGFSD